VAAMRMAKLLGYQVATNTTVYKETDTQEIEDMFAFLSTLGLDGHTIAPGYEYDAAKADMVKRLGIAPENFFLTRKMTIEKFAKVEEWSAKYPIFGTPVYLEFQIHRRAEDRILRTPLLHLGELLDRHLAGEEEIFWRDAKALHHVGLGRIVFVARRDRVTIKAER